MGPGKIANRLASSFEHVQGGKVYAVASRDEAKGKEFAKHMELKRSIIPMRRWLKILKLM